MRVIFAKMSHSDKSTSFRTTVLDDDRMTDWQLFIADRSSNKKNYGAQKWQKQITVKHGKARIVIAEHIQRIWFFRICRLTSVMSGTRLLGGWASFTKAWARSWLAEYLLLASTYKINVLDASLIWGIWGLLWWFWFILLHSLHETSSRL